MLNKSVGELHFHGWVSWINRDKMALKKPMLVLKKFKYMDVDLSDESTSSSRVELDVDFVQDQA